jgi:alginate O-acetyltransferase complex protein AlgI
VQFDSIAYVVFVAGVWLAYQVSPQRFRWLTLVLASLGFYAALRAPLLLVALGASAVVSHALGLRMSQETDGRRYRLLWTGIAANGAILCLVKYLHAILGTLAPFALVASGQANLFITIGVSYFTLQSISFLADVYLRRADPEPHFGRFALSLVFFPKVLQGPIERSGDLQPQLMAVYHFDRDNVRAGILLFAWGLFKKAAVANRLALYVDTVYGDVHSYGGISLLMATYMYALQIYADFSGYTDMALGVARIFNIRLTQNFLSPYLATSVAEFWRRWHISFSRWILDYIFRPLQLYWRNAGLFGTAAALMITFLFSGLWHGAAWGFVIWGLLHGTYLAGSVYYRPWAARLSLKVPLLNHRARRILQTVVTFHLVCLAWIFFRAASVSDAWYVLTHMFSGVGSYIVDALRNFRNVGEHRELVDPLLLGKTLPIFLLVLGSTAVMLVISTMKGRLHITARPTWVRWPLYFLLVAATAFFSIRDSAGFVYFQF